MHALLLIIYIDYVSAYGNRSSINDNDNDNNAEMLQCWKFRNSTTGTILLLTVAAVETTKKVSGKIIAFFLFF